MTVWGVFLLGCAAAGRAFGLAQQIGLLEELGAARSPALILPIELIWAAVFFGLFWRLRHRSARRATLLALFLYTGTQAARLNLLAADPAAYPAWPIRLLPLLAFGLFATWALLRRANAAYWRPAPAP